MEHIFILEEWVCDGCDWSARAIAVSVDKSKLSDLASKEGGPLLDCGETLHEWCETRNKLENREGRHKLSSYSYDSYYAISTIPIL